MAKGGFKGGYGGGFGGGGINMNMVRQAQKMQQDLLKKQAEVEEQEFTAASGGGAVSAVVSGKRELKSLTIQPDAVDPEDVEMLQDLVVAAVNEALRKAETAMSTAVSSFTGGVNLGI